MALTFDVLKLLRSSVVSDEQLLNILPMISTLEVLKLLRLTDVNAEQP